MAGIPNVLSNSRELLRKYSDPIIESLKKSDAPQQILEGIKGASNVIQEWTTNEILHVDESDGRRISPMFGSDEGHQISQGR